MTTDIHKEIALYDNKNNEYIKQIFVSSLIEL
jgi:hypothetical protein